MLLSPPFSPFRLNGRAELPPLYHREYRPEGGEGGVPGKDCAFTC